MGFGQNKNSSLNEKIEANISTPDKTNDLKLMDYAEERLYALRHKKAQKIHSHQKHNAKHPEVDLTAGDIGGLKPSELAEMKMLEQFLEKHGVAIRDSIEAREEVKRGMQIPEELLKDKTIMDLLKANGIIISDRGIIENPEVMEKYNRYIEVLSFLGDVNQRDAEQKFKDKTKIAENFNWLTSESSNEIWDKEYIQIKYAEAIYNDIIREGYFLQKHTDQNGVYSIQRVGAESSSQLVPAGSSIEPYADILKGTQVNSKVFDIVVVSSILQNNEAVYGKDITGQKTFLNSLLEQHRILPFPNSTQTEEAKFMLLDKEFVLKQIQQRKTTLSASGRNKIDGVNQPDDMKKYQELVFLENYIGKDDNTPGDYLSETYNKNLFERANQYRQVFLREKALIDAFESNAAQAEPKSFGDMLVEHRLVIGAAGLLAMIFAKGKTKGAGFMALIAAITAEPLGNMIDAGVKKGKQVTGLGSVEIDDASLELIRPDEITPPLSHASYQKKFTDLVKTNNKNRGANRVSSSVTRNPHLDTKTLYYISEDVTSKKINIDLNSASSQADIETALASQLGNANSKYTAENLATFMSLLRSNNSSHAKTTLDYFSEDGTDILNEAFTGVVITKESSFDEKINAIFRTAFYAGTTNVEKTKNRQATLELMKQLQSVLEDGWFESGDADVKTDDAIAIIMASNLENTQKQAVKGFLEKTKLYRGYVSKVESIGSGWNLSDVLPSDQTKLNNRLTEVQSDIDTLDRISAQLSLAVNDADLESSLQDQILQKKENLEKIKHNINLKIDEFLGGTASYNPSLLPNPALLNRVSEIETLIDPSRKLTASLSPKIDALATIDVSAQLQDAIQNQNPSLGTWGRIKAAFNFVINGSVPAIPLPSNLNTMTTQQKLVLERNLKIIVLNEQISAFSPDYLELKKLYEAYESIPALSPDPNNVNRYRDALRSSVKKFETLKNMLETNVASVVQELKNSFDTLNTSIHSLALSPDATSIQSLIDLQTQVSSFDASVLRQTQAISTRIGLTPLAIDKSTLETALNTKLVDIVSKIQANYPSGNVSTGTLAELKDNQALLMDLKLAFPGNTQLETALDTIERTIENKPMKDLPDMTSALTTDISTLDTKIASITNQIVRKNAALSSASDQATIDQISDDIQQLQASQDVHNNLRDILQDTLTQPTMTVSKFRDEVIRLILPSTPNTTPDIISDLTAKFPNISFQFTAKL